MQKIRFFNSGLYNEPSFYKQHDIEKFEIGDPCFREYFYYNNDLMKTRYSESEFSNLEESEINALVENDFFKDIQTHHTLFEPLIFNEELALDCGLLPFRCRYDDNKYELLALGNSGFDPLIKTKLDAYQVLTDNSIDEHSPLWGAYSKDIAKRVLGDAVYNRVIEAIKYLVIGNIINKEEIQWNYLDALFKDIETEVKS